MVLWAAGLLIRGPNWAAFDFFCVVRGCLVSLGGGGLVVLVVDVLVWREARWRMQGETGKLAPGLVGAF